MHSKGIHYKWTDVDGRWLTASRLNCASCRLPQTWLMFLNILPTSHEFANRFLLMTVNIYLFFSFMPKGFLWGKSNSVVSQNVHFEGGQNSVLRDFTLELKLSTSDWKSIVMLDIIVETDHFMSFSSDWF